MAWSGRSGLQPRWDAGDDDTEPRPAVPPQVRRPDRREHAPSSIGAVLARNVFRGDFDGPILPSTRSTDTCTASGPTRTSRACGHAELAVIATPPQTVPGIVAESVRAARAPRGDHAGFAEASAATAGAAARDARRSAAAQPAHRRPTAWASCCGIGLNASFDTCRPAPAGSPS